MQDWFCTISVRPLPLTLLFRANTANIHISLISQPLSIFADSSCWIAQRFLHPMLKRCSLSMCSLFAMDDTTLGKSSSFICQLHLQSSLTSLSSSSIFGQMSLCLFVVQQKREDDHFFHASSPLGVALFLSLA